MNEKTECEMNSKLILESLACGDPYLRKNYIGASDAPIIMGASPWRTPLQLYREKLGIDGPQKENEHMKRGNSLEDEARQKFTKSTGIQILPKRLFHPQIDYMMASLDGIDPSGKCIVEIKCPASSHKTSLCGQVPKHYYPQLQHQMIVADVKKMFYFSYTRDSCEVIECYRDDDYCEILLEKEALFWECLKNFIEPDMMNEDLKKQSGLIWSVYAKEWQSLQKSKKEILDREEEIKQNLISICEGESSIGSGIRVKKVKRKGNIDYSKVWELQSLDLEPYRKEDTEYWKISKVEE